VTVRVAALYDVHGNVPALAAVLRDVEAAGVDAIVLGGDILAGPWPAETYELLAGLGDAIWIRGNADRELAGGDVSAPRELVDWVAARLDEGVLRRVAALPLTVSLDVDGLGPVLFCHATPRDDTEIRTVLSSDDRWLEVLEGVQERTVVCGHTHVQFDRAIGEIRVVNAGSVGMPYANEPGAYWALFGPGVELRRTPYDTAATRDAIVATGIPTEWPQASPGEASTYFESLVETERVVIGRVGKPHGLDGSFYVERPSLDERWWRVGARLVAGGREVEVVGARRAQSRPVIKVEPPVERGASIEVERAALPPTDEDEYYAFELIGLAVEEESGRTLGTVKTVVPGVANDVLELDTGLLLPMVEDCVRDVDLGARRIVVATGFAD
jgi:ribosomal 30S subunit maturation factor RimM/predicted phosphodiesterase